ncbi:MAG: zinc ribbon domain-containing protein, partial [Methanobacteriaceae archaeon]
MNIKYYHKQVSFSYSSNFNVIDENNEGYIVRLGDNNTGAVITVSKGKNYKNLPLKDLKTMTENDLISKGNRILSSKITNVNSKKVLKLSYVFKHEGIDIVRNSVNFLEGQELYIVEFMNVKNDNHGNINDFKLVVDSFKFNKNFCPSCGTKNEENLAFCKNCGKKLSGLQDTNISNNNDNNTEKILIGVVVAIVILIVIGGASAFISLSNNNNNNNNNNTNGIDNLNNADTVTSSSISLSEVYGLAVALDKKAQTQDLSTISYVSYKGVTFTKEQCLYIFAKAIDMKNQGISGNI